MQKTNEGTTKGSAPKAITLRQLAKGEVAVVQEVSNGQGVSSRLKALGLCRGRRVQMVQPGDPLIIRVHGSRLGLSARVADDIRVAPCADCLVYPLAGVLRPEVKNAPG